MIFAYVRRPSHARPTWRYHCTLRYMFGCRQWRCLPSSTTVMAFCSALVRCVCLAYYAAQHVARQLKYHICLAMSHGQRE